jgi:hypothetical protein
MSNIQIVFNNVSYDTLEEAQAAEKEYNLKKDLELKLALDTEARNIWFLKTDSYKRVSNGHYNIIISSDKYTGSIYVYYFSNLNEFIIHLAKIFDNYRTYEYDKSEIIDSILNSVDVTFSKAAYVWENFRDRPGTLDVHSYRSVSLTLDSLVMV